MQLRLFAHDQDPGQDIDPRQTDAQRLQDHFRRGGTAVLVDEDGDEIFDFHAGTLAELHQQLATWCVISYREDVDREAELDSDWARQQFRPLAHLLTGSGPDPLADFHQRCREADF